MTPFHCNLLGVNRRSHADVVATSSPRHYLTIKCRPVGMYVPSVIGAHRGTIMS